MRALSSPRLLIAALALTFGLVGCTSGGVGGSTGTPRSSTNRIIEADLASLQQLDVFTAIQRLRPNWLRSRSGVEPVVMMHGTRQAGGLAALRSMRTSELQELQYMSASDATTRFGTGYEGGAILLTTKR